MNRQTMIQNLGRGESVKFPTNARTIEYARQLDAQDPLRSFRQQFRIPTKSSLKRKAVSFRTSKEEITRTSQNGDLSPGHLSSDFVSSKTQKSNELHQKSADEASIYFCGNSLGCQPKLVSSYLQTHLETWADHGVNAHFTDFDESPLSAWQDMAEACAKKSAPIFGASASEIVIMNTLTANLHLMMASFYKPTQQRHKIICEWKPFPSDFVSTLSYHITKIY